MYVYMYVCIYIYIYTVSLYLPVFLYLNISIYISIRLSFYPLLLLLRKMAVSTRYSFNLFVQAVEEKISGKSVAVQK